MLHFFKRTTVLSAFTILFSKITLSQSDVCTSPSLLTPGTTCSNITGTLFEKNNEGVKTSACGATYDVWYYFTTPANVNAVNIDASSIAAGGNNIDASNTFLEAFSGSACSPTLIGSCTPIGTTLSLTGLAFSTTYYVRVFTTSNPTSGNAGKWDYNICVTYTLPPTNDDCSGAITLSSGVTNNAGSVWNATASTGVGTGCATGNPDDDVWYKFTPAGNSLAVSLSAIGNELNNSGARLQLFSGACGTLTSVACGTTSITTAVTSGSTYYIRVYSFGTGSLGGTVAGSAFSITATSVPPVTIAAGRMKEVYQQTTLSGSNVLSYPWEIAYGPDNKLWITESRGYKVYRMDPATGAKTTVLDISMGSTWLTSPADSLNVQFNSNWPQGGLAGLAIHPNFLDGSGLYDYVYVSYVHRNLGGSSPTGLFFRNKLVRFTYNSGTGKLESPAVLCDTLPGSNDHNSQRIIIAPVTPGGTNYLFYASGDMGAGQFSNRTRPNRAQDPASYEGKILRFNLIADNDAGAAAWIPNDNPYAANSAVYSIGIRNNQGFAYDPALNILYGSSHGPYSDDEINIIQPFKNYGHPLIEGFADGNYDGSFVQGTDTSVSAGADYTSAGGVSSCPPIGSEAANKTAINANGNGLYKDPLFSAYPVPGGNTTTPGTVKYIWKNNPGNAIPAPGWPTEAWSGLDLYNHTVIPGWKNSLVAASLKWGRLLRIRLDAAGTATAPTNSVSDTVSYFNSQNRFRDLAFSPDGKDIFVIMDNSSTTSGPGSANPVVPNCAGCVQKYTFLGYADAGGKSSIPTSITVTPGVLNNCTTGTAITIDGTNNNLWVPITGPDGNIMAEIKANGNNLGAVTSSFYTQSGTIRQQLGKRYLNRNITITPSVQPASPVSVRLYMTKAEFDAMDADAASGVSAVTDLKILKNNDPCGSAIVSNTQLISPVYAEAHGTNGYVLQANINSFSSFYFGTSAITLPVELVYFKGSLQNNSAILQWETVNETNASHFIVERSLDSRSFENIGRVVANGNSTAAVQYSHIDDNINMLSSRVVYYRLKMVDTDGQFKYSAIVTINLADITNRIIVSPNPANDETRLIIASTTSGKATWKLIDNNGQVKKQSVIHIRRGANSVSINVAGLAAGLYYLQVSGAGFDQNVKFQKL